MEFYFPESPRASCEVIFSSFFQTFVEINHHGLNHPMPKPQICILERKNYYAIKLGCNDHWNIGLLETRDGSLADNAGKTGSLGEMINNCGGDFTRIVGLRYVKSQNGTSKTCGGTAYTGWVDFGSVAAAIEYLERYFTVIRC
jgi:hypothetical protein